MKDLGIAAIEEMVATQEGAVDWVVVELTGVADPGEHIKEASAEISSTHSKVILGQRGDGRPCA